MTAAEKKERRQLRHKLQGSVKTTTRFRLSATGKQMRTAARKITDVILSGKNPANIIESNGNEVNLERRLFR